jgi:hypothetical protein
MARTIDWLSTNIAKREKLIEERIMSTLDNIKKEDRVLFEHKDWSKETQEVGSFEPTAELVAEDVISVN